MKEFYRVKTIAKFGGMEADMIVTAYNEAEAIEAAQKGLIGKAISAQRIYYKDLDAGWQAWWRTMNGFKG